MTEATESASKADDLPLHIISYAWGELYVEELLSFAVPALLAPGNLPAIASELKAELVLLSEERLFDKISNHPAIAKVKSLCPVRLVGLDDLVTRPDKYGMALTFALHRAFADLGPAMTDHWLIFFNADFILADGSLTNLLRHLRQGERIVASPSYCTVKEDVIRDLRRRLSTNPTVLRIEPREMARVILQHRHNTIRGKTINQDRFHLLQADQFYWEVDENTLIGHQMPVAIVGMRPERYLAEPNSYWDHGLMAELCPTADIKVLGDSDKFLMLELRGGEVASDQIVSGLPDPEDLGRRMIGWVTPYQASFAYRPLTLHAADCVPSIAAARSQLDEYVQNVLSFAPQFPSHIDHPQWNYHWPEFMKARHSFLSTRLGSITETQTPPPTALPTDKLWWRYDGAEKTLTRKTRLMDEEKKRQVKAHQDALNDANRELEQILNRPIYSTVILQRGLDNGIAPPPTAPERKDAIERTNQKKRELEIAIANIEQSYRASIEPLERERRNLLREYGEIVQPRVRSAGIPIIHWNIGAEHSLGISESRLRRVARSAYYRIFGRWPHLTMLNPYRSCLQPMLQSIRAAKSAGASDVLVVSNKTNLSFEEPDSQGKVAHVSRDDFLSGLIHLAFDPLAKFDLCIVDLSAEDLVQFPEIVKTAKPYLRPGGTIVGFSLLSGRFRSEIHLGDVPGELIITGSKASARAMAAYSTALSGSGGSRTVRLVRALFTLLVNAPRFWWVNYTEAAAARRGRRPDPAFSTGLTIIVRVTAPTESTRFKSKALDVRVEAGETAPRS
jgi:hypothetical protein